jgi:hypothetical protein
MTHAQDAQLVGAEPRWLNDGTDSGEFIYQAVDMLGNRKQAAKFKDAVVAYDAGESDSEPLDVLSSKELTRISGHVNEMGMDVGTVDFSCEPGGRELMERGIDNALRAIGEALTRAYKREKEAS